MAWNSINPDDVIEGFTPAEQAVLQNIQADTAQVNLILTRIINKVRGQIKAGGNLVDQSGATIPDQLRDEVIAITKWKWLNSFPGLKTLKTKDREDAAKEAEALLKEISSQNPNRPRVELPATADGTPAPTTMPSVGNPKRKYFRREDGI